MGGKTANQDAGQARRELASLAPRDWDLELATRDIAPEDQRAYQELVSTELSPEQVEMVVNPDQAHPRTKKIMAVHWHPEWVPMELVTRRLQAMFPNCRRQLIIPTQHNQILTYGDYAGVEVDCYSSGFNRKVQLLLHFRADRLQNAGVLRSMLDHTFKYRSSQLFEFMDTVTEAQYEERLQEAAHQTGANEDQVQFVRFFTARLRRLILENEDRTPAQMIKNKLLTEYIQAQRGLFPDTMVSRAVLLLKAVKDIVKQHFSFDYFFRASEVIEEARSLGGGVVIPHPEQFWPILLADYDVDGWEVWNPQSREYTEFLIKALGEKNKNRRPGRRQLLVFMGDDTHMSVKIKDPATLEPSKLQREVGLQPAWEEVAIRKSLSLSGASLQRTMEDYSERLA